MSPYLATRHFTFTFTKKKILLTLMCIGHSSIPSLLVYLYSSTAKITLPCDSTKQGHRQGTYCTYCFLYVLFPTSLFHFSFRFFFQIFTLFLQISAITTIRKPRITHIGSTILTTCTLCQCLVIHYCIVLLVSGIDSLQTSLHLLQIIQG